MSDGGISLGDGFEVFLGCGVPIILRCRWLLVVQSAELCHDLAGYACERLVFMDVSVMYVLEPVVLKYISEYSDGHPP